MFYRRIAQSLGPAQPVQGIAEQDCRRLKDRVVDQVRQAGLRPWDAAGGRGEVLFRIAVEELEAWSFGDPEAVLAAYPKVPKNFVNRAAYRDPDGVRGGTWEAMERLLRRAGYFPNGLNNPPAHSPS